MAGHGVEQVETTSVDLAKRSRELSEAHFVANGLELDHHRFIVMDVLIIISMPSVMV